jgi:hypothetical protein
VSVVAEAARGGRRRAPRHGAAVALAVIGAALFG